MLAFGWGKGDIGCGVASSGRGLKRRKSSSVGLQNSNQCRQSLPLGPNVNWTFTADGRLESGSGVCLSVEKTPGPQLWSKPLSDSKLDIPPGECAASDSASSQG